MGSPKRFIWAVIGIVAVVLPSSAQATFPGANGKIAFVRDSDIWTVNPDGSNEVNITNTPTANEASPAWSADGKRIAYVRLTPFQPYDGSSQIWVMNADGTGQTLIVPAPTDPNMCSFGGTVIYSSLGSPHWSPDGSKLVYHHFRNCRPSGGPQESPESDLYTVNADGSGQTLLKALSAAGPVWSPDGTKIGYSGGCYASSCNTVSWITPDGSQDVAVHLADGEASFRDWHPWQGLMQGRGERFTGFYWFTVRPDGSGYTEFPPSNIPGKWSPDGTKFLQSGVYVKNVDGSGSQQITIGSEPDWQPITTNYPRPRGASPLRVHLVVAYEQCTASNSTHGGGLPAPSCVPPVQESDHLTVGTPDSNGLPAATVGSVTYRTVVGDPSTPANEADVKIEVAISGVLTKSLAPYGGELRTDQTLRITDRNNGSGTTPGTAQDSSFPVTVPCASGSCTAGTTANTLVPGTVVEGKRSVWELGQIEVRDAGPNGTGYANCPPVCGDGDESTFLREGVFVP